MAGVQGTNNSYASPQPIAEADTNANVRKNEEAGGKTQGAFIGLAQSGFSAAGGAAGGGAASTAGAVTQATTNQTNNVNVNGSDNSVVASNAAITTANGGN